MISIERLFCLISQQGIRLESVSGRGVMNTQEACHIIGRVQEREPTGVKVIEATVIDSPLARVALAKAAAAGLATLTCDGEPVFSPLEAGHLGVMAVQEVTGSRRCGKCKGVGFTISRRYGNRPFECRRCCGNGTEQLTAAMLRRKFAKAVGREVTEQEWDQRIYGRYMDVVDLLHRSAGDAEAACKRILRLIQAEMAA